MPLFYTCGPNEAMVVSGEHDIICFTLVQRLSELPVGRSKRYR